MMNTSFSPAQCDVAVKEFPYEEICAGTAAGLGSASGSRSDHEAQREVAAHEAGVREGETRARAQFEAAARSMREAVAAELARFANERREYFHRVEQEVVQLAVNIARRILRREAHIDPLLLAGMVRVALEQMGKATRVSIRVNPHQVSDYRMFFAAVEENPPEIVEDPALPPEECVLHTELGKVEIGPEVQLKEIEAGLLDLQAARPER